MDRPKIGAREAAKDINSGMADAELMEKYKLTAKGLESLFRKLVEAKLLDESILRERSVSRPDKKIPAPAQPRSLAKKSKTDEVEEPSELALTVLQDMKDGRHDIEIMRLHEISPSTLKQIREELTRSGLLAEAEVRRVDETKVARCPFCSQVIKPSASQCPHCDRKLEPETSAAPLGAGVPSPGFGPGKYEEHEETLEEEKECPWEERENYGTLNAYFQTATKCILTPTSFFSKLPTKGGYFSPILFAVMAIPVTVFFTYLWWALFKGGGLGGLIGFFLAMCFLFAIGLIFVPIALALWSAVLHLFLYILGGAREGYQATFRVVSYSSITSIFNAVPFVGNLASLWGLVLTTIGLRETHKTTTGKAAAAVAIPLILAVALSVIMGITSFLHLGKSGSLRAGTVPNEACQALETYMARVDWAASLNSKEMEAELQSAIGDFVKELESFRGQSGINLLQQKAVIFGLAVAQQTKAGTESSSAVDKLRVDLESMCKK